MLFAAGIGVAAWNNWQLAGIVAGYAAMTTAYSFWLKTIPVVDLVVLSAGFILRLLGGAYAAQVGVSDWFLIISCFGSLFIAAAKRYAEKKELGDRAAELRPTLGEYSVEYLGLVRGVAAASVLMSYCMWAVERVHVSPEPRARGSSCRSSRSSSRSCGMPCWWTRARAPRRKKSCMSDRQMQLMGVLLVLCLFVGIYG